MDLVLKLRELRRLRGLSQKQAAEHSDMGPRTLSTFETGRRIASIKVEQLLALLRAYDMTPAEFFGGAVEYEVFSEFEHLDERELAVIRELRRVPEAARERVFDYVLTMIEGAVLRAESGALRVVR